MYLSKSKYCKGIQCPKMLWLEKNNIECEDVNNEQVFSNGNDVGELAKNLFGFHIDVSFNENLNTMISDTNALLLNKNIVITEASFNYNNNFCSVDILKKNNNDYEIYEVKSSTEIKDIYIDDLSYQYYILTKLGYNVTKASLVYINSNYNRIGDLDLNELFNIEDYTLIAKSKLDIVEKNIIDINNIVDDYREPFKDIDNYCFKPYECPYFKYCSGLKDNNVFDIRRLSNKKKIEYYKRNIITYEQLLNSDLDDKYKMQIDFELNNKEEYINKKNIKDFMDELVEPIYFLDFETYQSAIPEFDNTHPYEQIPFQYSLHILDNELSHKEFLSKPGIDPRRSLAECLVKDIPMNALTLAYNMQFEKMVIKKLASLYEDLSEHLMNIYDNMKDLMIPFYRKDYYNKDMHGSYSIKYVLPALFPNDPSLDYHNLDMIHKGDEASNAFIEMRNMNEEEQSVVRDNLLKYCGLDTYAMVCIYNRLKEIVGE